jgi:hypothetical protein
MTRRRKKAEQAEALRRFARYSCIVLSAPSRAVLISHRNVANETMGVRSSNE